MPILNYTSTVPALRSAGQVQDLLARHGADQVAVRYADSKPVAISFLIDTEHGARQFRMPVNVEGVFAAMRTDPQVPQRLRSRQQAERVAWRIVKDWTEVQLALIQAGLSRMDEVMLPYMVVGDDGQTLSQRYQISATMRQAIEGES